VPCALARSRPSMRLLIIASVLALCGCSASHHRSLPTPTTSPVPPLTTRLELRRTVVVAGGTIAGALIVDNESGGPIHMPMCAGWEVQIANDEVPAQAAWVAKCGPGPVLAAGRHQYPFTATATYRCGPKPPPTGPCGDNGPPPLPSGDYRAVFVQIDMPIPVPAPAPVRVVAPPKCVCPIVRGR
jgi:hypothetical protein